MKEKRKFSSEQKAQIVLSVVKKELTALEAGKKHQITPGLIHKWVDNFLAKAHRVFEESQNDKERNKKVQHYEWVIAKLTTQNDFLEKVLAVTR